MARNAKRSEGLHAQGKRKETAGKSGTGFLNRRPPVQIRAGSLRKSAENGLIQAAAKPYVLPPWAVVELALSGGDFPAPSALAARIARTSSGFVVRAHFDGPDGQRHGVEASAASFAGALAELTRAIAASLEVAR